MVRKRPIRTWMEYLVVTPDVRRETCYTGKPSPIATVIRKNDLRRAYRNDRYSTI